MAVLGVLLFAVSAHAEDKTKARAAYQIGTQHYDLAEYQEALTAFKEAYRNYEDPTILYNIGQCYRQLGDKEQAIRFYRTYLIKQPDSARKDEVRGMIARLEQLVSEEKATRASPPQGTIPPEPGASAPSATSPSAASTASPSPPASSATSPTPTAAALTASAPSRKTPVYKKWWFWTITGVVVVGAVGLGLGLGLSSGSTPSANTDFGTVHPF